MSCLNIAASHSALLCVSASLTTWDRSQICTLEPCGNWNHGPRFFFMERLSWAGSPEAKTLDLWAVNEGCNLWGRGTQMKPEMCERRGPWHAVTKRKSLAVTWKSWLMDMGIQSHQY